MQLLRVAGEILVEQGIEHVRIPEVAKRAGVSRPVVYRFFANRQGLLLGILEDFRLEIERRFEQAIQSGSDDVRETVLLFVDAICETIDAKGPAAWLLLDGQGPDPELAREAGKVRKELVGPWRSEIAAMTGAGPAQVEALSEMLVATTRAVIRLWIDKTLSRAQAVEALLRGIAALLDAFAE